MGGRIIRVVLAAPSEAKPKWFDKVDGKVLSALSEKEKKRQEVIFELIQTEKDFVRDLDIIINVRGSFLFFFVACLPFSFSTSPLSMQVFLVPMRKKKLVNVKDIAILFSNVEQLVPVNMVSFSILIFLSLGFHHLTDWLVPNAGASSVLGDETL